MKTISKIITVTLFAFVSLTSVSAYAEGKIGYVNTGKLLQDLPQMKALEKKIENQGKSQRADLDRLKRDLEAKVEKIRSQGSKMQQSELDNLRIDISTMQAKLEVQAKEFNSKMAAIEREEMVKINEQIQNAINSVAKSEGYDFILNGQALAYAKEGSDVTDAVLKKLK